MLVGAIWEVMLYKYSWRKVGEVANNFVHSGKFKSAIPNKENSLPCPEWGRWGLTLIGAKAIAKYIAKARSYDTVLFLNIYFFI